LGCPDAVATSYPSFVAVMQVIAGMAQNMVAMVAISARQKQRKNASTPIKFGTRNMGFANKE
jgi:hypothetical protein